MTTSVSAGPLCGVAARARRWRRWAPVRSPARARAWARAAREAVGLAEVAHRPGGGRVGDLHHDRAGGAEEREVELAELAHAAGAAGLGEQLGALAGPARVGELGLPLAQALGEPPRDAALAELDGVDVGELVPEDLMEVVGAGVGADAGDEVAEAHADGAEAGDADRADAEVVGVGEHLDAQRAGVHAVALVEGLAGLGDEGDVVGLDELGVLFGEAQAEVAVADVGVVGSMRWS
jgi:hypothetical protein